MLDMVDKPCAIGNNHALTNPSADPSVPHDHGSSDDKDISHTLEDRETGMDRVISRITSRSSYPDPGPPPDGGLQAWTQAVMGHLVVFNTWGYIISFGVFQSYYVTTLNHPPSDVSWVGSVQIFLLFFIGTFSGRATDYGLFRATFLLGSFFLLLGVFMTSLSTRYIFPFSLPISGEQRMGHLRLCYSTRRRRPARPLCTYYDHSSSHG